VELKIATAFLLCLVVGGCGLAASITLIQMVETVNAMLPKEERIEVLWWYWPKTVRFYRTYRSLCPGSRLLHRLHWLYGTALTSLVAAAALLGFPFGTVAWMACGGGVLFWLHMRAAA
jgi:hypothetical protein